MLNTKRGFARIGVAIAILVVLGVGGYLWKQKSASPVPTPAPGDNSFTTLSVPTDTSTWKTYRNEEHGFEFKYPESWYLEQFNDAGYDDNAFYIWLSPKAFVLPTGGIDSHIVPLDISINKSSRFSRIIESNKKDSNLKETSLPISLDGLKFSGLEAIYIGDPLGPTRFITDIFLPFPDDYVLRLLYRSSGTEPDNNAVVLDQILSTFRFIK